MKILKLPSSIIACLFPFFLHAQSNNKEYFVAFCSHSVNSSSLGGHAFIAIGKGQPFTCTIDGTGTEVFGLYAKNENSNDCLPNSYNAAKSFFVGSLPGCIFNDAKTEMNNLLIIHCNAKRYFQVLSEISKWKNKNYELSIQDCLTFVQSIASDFKYLQMPVRTGLANYPNKFIIEMIKLNGKEINDSSSD